MRPLALVILLTACSASAPAPNPSSIRLPSSGKADGHAEFTPYHCPDGWRFAPSGGDAMYCVYDSLLAPASSVADCDLAAHRESISWDAGDDYTCPDLATSGDHSCSFAVPDSPPDAIPYCEYLSYGYIGYLWEMCPPDATVGEHRCSFTGLNVPAGAREYCEYLNLGYFGYYWQLAADEQPTCPSGFVYGDNGEGYGFCVVENLSVPAELTLRAACDDLASGTLGFTW